MRMHAARMRKTCITAPTKPTPGRQAQPCTLTPAPLSPVDSEDWPDSQASASIEEAIFHTPEEQTFIWDLLPRGHWNAYWIGISDEKAEDDWYWVDGNKLVGGFWEDGEPNNHDEDEDCCYIMKTEVLSRIATKSWYDAPCYTPRGWICEKETDASS